MMVWAFALPFHKILPDAVVDNRTSIKEQYNETFLDNQDIFDELW